MSEEQKDFLPPVAQAEAVYSSARIPIASVIEILPNETTVLPAVATTEEGKGEQVEDRKKVDSELGGGGVGSAILETSKSEEVLNAGMNAEDNAGEEMKEEGGGGEEESVLSPEAERVFRAEEYVYLKQRIEDAGDDPVALAEAQDAFDNFDYDENGDLLPEETDDEGGDEEEGGDEDAGLSGPGEKKGKKKVKKDVANLYIRAEDLDGWVMSPDEPVELEWSMTINEFFDWISHNRPHIPAGRIDVEFSGKKVPTNKYNWDLRRLGVRDGAIAHVRPTLLRAWTWHSIGYYEDAFMREMAQHIVETRDGRLNLDDVPNLVPLPPVLGEIKHFIRKHPEKIFLRCDVNTGKTWASINKGWQLPSFEHLPVEMGHIKEYEPVDFNWDAYADANSQKPIIQESTK